MRVYKQYCICINNEISKDWLNLELNKVYSVTYCRKINIHKIKGYQLRLSKGISTTFKNKKEFEKQFVLIGKKRIYKGTLKEEEENE